VFDVFLERGAERDLRRLIEPIHNRIIRRSMHFRKTLDHQVAGNLAGAKTIGEYASVIIV
jgi:hypothetical protein